MATSIALVYARVMSFFVFVIALVYALVISVIFNWMLALSDSTACAMSVFILLFMRLSSCNMFSFSVCIMASIDAT